MAANYYPILSAIQTIVNGLTLKDWNGNALPIAIRKLPKVDEDIDTLPLLCIVPRDEPAKRKVIAFGPIYRVTYPADVVFVAANNKDFTSHLDTYMAWHGSVEAAFDKPDALKSLVAAVWDVNVRPGLVIDPAELNDNYDYGGLTIEAVTTESN